MNERYLLDKKEEIKEVNVLPRDLYPTLTHQFVTVLVGPRRAGKSFLIYDIIKNKLHLSDDDYLYINLEDPEIEPNIRLIKDAVNTHISIYGKRPGYIFLDEIQNMNGWERAISSIHEGGRYKIVITGSNSRVTSKEIATSMRGRSISHLVLPLSFPEFLRFKYNEKFEAIHSSYSESKLIKKFHKYMKLGGFPQVVLSPHTKQQFLSDYKDVVVFRDIIERYNIRNLKLLYYLLTSIESSVASTFSIHKIFNDVKSMGMKVSKKTLYTYYMYILNALFFFEVKKFYRSKKSREKALPKVYLCDHIFLRNEGRIFENIIFSELVRTFGLSNIYYLSDASSELDFILEKPLTAIQVAYGLNKQTLERETRGFHLLKTPKKYIITVKKYPLKNIRNISFFELVSHKGKSF
ncbi:MAG: ATP-binding protein [Candidatus Diapherotrites archaeon]|nr:ATP-binding protein [Candidatus Diapherotrites archaeon]